MQLRRQIKNVGRTLVYVAITVQQRAHLLTVIQFRQRCDFLSTEQKSTFAIDDYRFARRSLTSYGESLSGIS